jgi:hypothetical protein
MIITTFINELENKIKIKIKNKKDTGVNYKTQQKIKFDSVSISISGPTSVSENVITYKEASELYLALQKFFDTNNKN